MGRILLNFYHILLLACLSHFLSIRSIVFFYKIVLPSIHPSLLLTVIFTSVCLSILQSIHPPSIHQPIQSSTHLPNHPSSLSYIHSSSSPSTHPKSTHSPKLPSIHPSIHLSIHPDTARYLFTWNVQFNTDVCSANLLPVTSGVLCITTQYDLL